MARLPQPGGDSGNWGQILNEFLSQTHVADGSLKADIITDKQLAADAVAEAKLAPAVRAKLNAPATSTGVADGSITAAKLANGAVVTAKIGDGTVTEAKLDQAVINKLNAAGSGTVGDGTLSAAKLNTGTGTNGQVLTLDSSAAGGFKWQTMTTGSAAPTGPAGGVLAGTYPNPTLASDAVTLAHLSVSGTPTAGQVLSYNGSNGLSWAAPATGGGTVADATTGAKGIVQLAGDLAGSADAPTVAKVNGIAVTGTPAAGQVLKATSATAASWQADATGGSSSTPAFTFRTVTADTTAANNEYILADATANGVTITLPAPSVGGVVRVKRMTATTNGVQIIAPAGSFIDAVSVGSDVLGAQYTSMEYLSDGTNWYR